MTFYEATVRARGLLTEAGIQPDTATRDAELLARHVLGWELATWLTHRGEPATDSFTAVYDGLMKRRLAREPVAYIRGVQEFWGREFVVTPAVLIPRSETELVVELASEYLRERPRSSVVDVGTGSGCIAVTLALDHHEATVFATDISPAALNVARTNAAHSGASDKIRFLLGSFLADAPRPVDLIVSNPPYVAAHDRAGLAPEVRDHEPEIALYGGDDGWRDIRALLDVAAAALSSGGVLVLEVGYGQADDMVDFVDSVPRLRLDAIRADLQGIPRAVKISARE